LWYFSTDLDWKRTFGLYLWYGIEIEAPIKKSVVLYENTFKQNGENITEYPKNALPFVSYLPQKPQILDKEIDICFHLLKIYTQDDYVLENGFFFELFFFFFNFFFFFFKIIPFF